MISKEKCKFCNREINPDIESTLQEWGIIEKKQCPKCRMILNVELKGFPKTIRQWHSVKELLEEYYKKSGARIKK